MSQGEEDCNNNVNFNAVQLVTQGPHPAVKILSLFGLPHSPDVCREDGEESTEHSVRLGPAGVFGEQAVHDGGALHD